MGWLEDLARITSKSVVRDKGGAPRMLFHGSPRAFNEPLSLDKASGHSLIGPGIYLTSDPLVASGYAFADSPYALGAVQKLQEIASKLANVRDNASTYSNYYTGSGKAKELSRLYRERRKWQAGVPKGWAEDTQALENQDWMPYSLTGQPNIRPVVLNAENLFDFNKHIDANELAKTVEGIRTQDPIQTYMRKMGSSNPESLGGPLIDDRNNLMRILRDSQSEQIPDFNEGLYHSLVNLLPKNLINSALQKSGYDAIKYSGGGRVGPLKHDAYVALDPKKVLNPYTLTPASLIASLMASKNMQQEDSIEQ